MMERKTFIRAAVGILLSLGAVSALLLERVVPVFVSAVLKAV